MKIQKDLVTVIVPVYNAQEYLPKCLDSILSQTYANLEIILVDDGSKDESLKILREYEKRDTRVKVYTKENGGVSSTRNLGIKAANGEYIAFIDADDYVEPEYVKFLVDAVSTADFAMCCWGDLYLPKGDRIRHELTNDELERLAGNITEDFYYLNYYFRYPCLKLYKRNIILNNKLCFPEDYPDAEDQAFNFSYYEYASNYTLVNKALYWYCHRNRQSLSKTTTRKSYTANLKKLALEKNFLEKHKVSHRERILNDSSLRLMRKYVHISREPYTFECFCERCAELRPYISFNEQGNSWRQNILLLLLKYNLLLVVWFYYRLLKYLESMNGRRNNIRCTPPPRLTYRMRRVALAA